MDILDQVNPHRLPCLDLVTILVFGSFESSNSALLGPFQIWPSRPWGPNGLEQSAKLRGMNYRVLAGTRASSYCGRNN